MSTNPEATYDVSVDYNMLNDAILAIKNIKSKCSQLISSLSSVDVSILDSAGEMYAAIATAEGVMDGPVDLVLNRIMEVETLFYMMQNEDFFKELQEDMQNGEFNDDKGDLDIVSVMERIIRNADGRYQDLLQDEDFRRIFIEQNILSVYGISSMEELDSISNEFLKQTQSYECQKNEIVYSASRLTMDFLNLINIDYDGFYGDFDTTAANTIMAYSYVDASGVEIMVDSWEQVPKAKKNDAKALSFTDLCGDTEEYQKLKGFLDGHMHAAAMIFNSDFSDFQSKLNIDIESDKVRLAELDKLINGDIDENKNYITYGSRTNLEMVNGIKSDVVSRTEHLSKLYGYMLSDDFDKMCQDLDGDEVVAAIGEYKDGLRGAGFSVNQIKVNNRSDEMNILYSLISNNGEFVASNGTVSFMKPGMRFSLSSAGDDTLSNYAYWASEMTDDEKACFYYEWNKNGADAAYDYLQEISEVLDTRWVVNQREIDSSYASENKVAASVISVLANPFEGLKALKYSIQQGINDDNMTHTQVYSRGDTMRQQVSLDLTNDAEWKGFVYNVGMSMADNMYSMALTGANAHFSGLLLGLSSYNDSLNDAMSRGLTDDQARLFAFASAGVEMLTEEFAIEKLLKIKPILGIDIDDATKAVDLTNNQKIWKRAFDFLDEVDGYSDNVFRNSVLPKIDSISNLTLRNRTYDIANVIYNGVKQGIGEGNEELVSGIAGRIIDDWIADENSSYNISLQQYINQGYTEAEAIAMANREYKDELVTSWLSGFASGNTMGGGQTVIGLAANDIKVNNVLSEYKSNPNYENQLKELSTNMREGYYDRALMMVLDSGDGNTTYTQNYQDALKIVDAMQNKGMIKDDGRTQLTTFLENDAKINSMLEGTAYENGGSNTRNYMRAGSCEGAVISTLLDSSNNQRFDDASKIINAMEKGGMIDSSQRDNMLVAVENCKTAANTVEHLQKGDAAVTLASRKNSQANSEAVSVQDNTEVTRATVSDSYVASSITDTDSDSKATDSAASDLSISAGALEVAGLGLAATGSTSLGTAIATLGTETDTSDNSNGRIYGDERIVIKDDSRDIYEQQRTLSGKEVSQSELNSQLENGEYELKDGESLGSRIGTQFFANPKTNSGVVKDGINLENDSNTETNLHTASVDGESLSGKIGIQFFAKNSDPNSKFSLKRMFMKNNVSIDAKVSELRDFINHLPGKEDQYSVAYELVSKINKTDDKVLKSLPIDVIEAAVRKGYITSARTPKGLINNIMTNSSDGKLLSLAINFYDNLIDDSVLIHKVLDSGYAITSRSPKFIRENYEYVSKFINNSNSASITNFVNILDPNVFTEEQLSNIITMATKKGLVIDRFNTASYIKNSPKLIMNIVNNASSLDLISSVITHLNISILSDSDMKQLVAIAKDLGYKLDINSPIVELNRGLNLLEDDKLLNSFDSDYHTALEKLITKVGYIHVYFEGYDGIFSKEVVDLFGVDNVYQIYKYCNLVNVRLDFNELISRGDLKAFKDLYDIIYASNNIDSDFDILYFKRFVSKYLSYDSIFHDVINRNLSESEILSLKSFVRSSFDIKISSYEELLNYNNLVKEYVLDVVNNGSIDDIKDVSSKLLFNQDYSQTVEFFRDVADSERLYSLAMELKDADVDFSYILNSYGALFDTFDKIVINGSDVQRMKDFILAINNSTDSNILMMHEDVIRNIKYYYGLELNKTLTKLDGFVRHNSMFSGTKYSISGTVEDSKSAVDYIEVNSKYRLLQHKLNYGASSGGKLVEYLNPRLIGNTYLCLSLIGDNKTGVSKAPSSINEVTLLFDEIIPRNLLLCSSTDLHSAEYAYNSLDVYAKDPYRFDLAEKILGDTFRGWWNEYTIYRENVKPSGILVTGDVPSQVEIDAAATLGVPLVKINYDGNNLDISADSKNSSSEPIIYDGARNGGTVIDASQDVGYELSEGESLGSRIGTQFFANPKSDGDTQSPSDGKTTINSEFELVYDGKKTDGGAGLGFATVETASLDTETAKPKLANDLEIRGEVEISSNLAQRGTLNDEIVQTDGSTESGDINNLSIVDVSSALNIDLTSEFGSDATTHISSIADLLVKASYEDDASTRINEILSGLDKNTLVDTVKYLVDNNLADCDFVGAVSPNTINYLLEYFYENDASYIKPLIESIPGVMANIVDYMISNNSNVNVDLIEKCLSVYDDSMLFAIIDRSSLLKARLNDFAGCEFVERVNSYRQNHKAFYKLSNNSVFRLSYANMDTVTEFINSINECISGNSSISINELLTEVSLDTESTVVLLDKILSDDKYAGILGNVIEAINPQQMTNIVDNLISNNYDLKKLNSYLTVEQFISVVDDIFKSSDYYNKIRVFLEQTSFEKILTAYDVMSYRQFSNLNDVLDVSLIKICMQNISDGSLETYVKSLSDSDFIDFINEVSKQVCLDINDIVETIINYERSRFDQIIKTLKYDENFSDFIKNVLSQSVSRESYFERYAIEESDSNYSYFGIDQGIIKKYNGGGYIVTDISWMKSPDDFAEFIVRDYKSRNPKSSMTKEEAIAITTKLSSGKCRVRSTNYELIIRYLSENYLIDEVRKIQHDSFDRCYTPQYQRVLNKLVSNGTDVVTATRILDCVDSTGVCSYASIANLIFDYYKDIPAQFKHDFGFDLYVEIDGQLRINEIELLADMYISINSNLLGGTLFNYDDGKYSIVSGSVNTEKQVYLSSSNAGVKTDIINAYLRLKNSSFSINREVLSFGVNSSKSLTVEGLKKIFVDALQDAKCVDLGIYKTSKKITLLYADGGTCCSTMDWNEGKGHAVYVVGVNNDSVIVSSWGKKLYIPLSDLVGNRFTISIVSNNLNPTFAVDRLYQSFVESNIDISKLSIEQVHDIAVACYDSPSDYSKFIFSLAESELSNGGEITGRTKELIRDAKADSLAKLVETAIKTNADSKVIHTIVSSIIKDNLPIVESMLDSQTKKCLEKYCIQLVDSTLETNVVENI